MGNERFFGREVTNKVELQEHEVIVFDAQEHVDYFYGIYGEPSKYEPQLPVSDGFDRAYDEGLPRSKNPSALYNEAGMRMYGVYGDD